MLLRAAAAPVAAARIRPRMWFVRRWRWGWGSWDGASPLPGLCVPDSPAPRPSGGCPLFLPCLAMPTHARRLFWYAPGAVTDRAGPLLTAHSLRSSAGQRKRHGRVGWDCSGSGAPTPRYAGQRAGTSGRLFPDERRPFLTFDGLFAASYFRVGNGHVVLISRFFFS